jgi:hypothetical protein
MPTVETSHPENWQAWLDNLRSTDTPQVRERLTGFVPAEGPRDEVLPEPPPKDERDNWRQGYCCLGLGAEQAEVDFDFDAGLAPFGFIQWLGFEEDARALTDYPEESSWDLVLDFDTDAYPQQGREDEHSDEVPEYDSAPTAAWLNDEAGLTFAQIADMLDYFGVWGVQA